MRCTQFDKANAPLKRSNPWRQSEQSIARHSVLIESKDEKEMLGMEIVLRNRQQNYSFMKKLIGI